MNGIVQVKFTIGIIVSDTATRESTGGANAVEREKTKDEGESEGSQERGEGCSLVPSLFIAHGKRV